MAPRMAPSNMHSPQPHLGARKVEQHQAGRVDHALSLQAHTHSQQRTLEGRGCCSDAWAVQGRQPAPATGACRPKCSASCPDRTAAPAHQDRHTLRVVAKSHILHAAAAPQWETQGRASGMQNSRCAWGQHCLPQRCLMHCNTPCSSIAWPHPILPHPAPTHPTWCTACNLLSPQELLLAAGDGLGSRVPQVKHPNRAVVAGSGQRLAVGRP